MAGVAAFAGKFRAFSIDVMSGELLHESLHAEAAPAIEAVRARRSDWMLETAGGCSGDGGCDGCGQCHE